jgi:hypothetical protein
VSRERARQIADAVLYEGYLLYPYRASSAKNQVRWQFGVLGPPGAAALGAGEEPAMRAECLVQPLAPVSVLDVRLRCLQLQSRIVERAVPRLQDDAGFVPVPELREGDRRWLSWDEAVEQQVDVDGVRLDQLLRAPLTRPVRLPAGDDVEDLRGDDADPVGRLRRVRARVDGVLELSACEVPADGDRSASGDGRRLVAVRARWENTTPWAAGGDRGSALARSFLGAHMVLSVRAGRFISLLEPPDWAARAAAERTQERCWPVLVGDEDTDDVVLVSPILLYDRPAVARESPADLFDATEIDEILTLRIMTMTDDEKDEARATDPRAAALVDRVDTMPAADLARLHGAVREAPSGAGSLPHLDTGGMPWWDPAADASVSPATDAVEVGGVQVRRGSVVRLTPRRRADAQDLFLAGRAATVTGVLFDVDGQVHGAVILADDPGADVHEWYGRFLYFGADEIEPIGAEA